jgi:hypothetical protein
MEISTLNKSEKTGALKVGKTLLNPLHVNL